MGSRIEAARRARVAGALLAMAVLLAGCAPAPSPVRAGAGGQPRIVSLAPAITETVFALGAGSEVVGVSQYCSYPPAAAGLPRVGTFLTPNIEAIAALQPTIVMVPRTSADVREVKALAAMGYRTLMVDEDSIAGIRSSIGIIGEAIGRAGAARAVLAGLDRQIDAIERRLRAEPLVRVLMIVGHEPLIAVGPGTYLDQLLTMARATNIADAAAQSWPHLSLEYVIATRPQVILDGQMGTDPVSPRNFWSRYTMIPAVRDHRVTGYPEDPTLHPGPRIGLTLQLLARRIHPAAFAADAAR